MGDEDYLRDYIEELQKENVVLANKVAALEFERDLLLARALDAVISERSWANDINKWGS